MQEKCPCLTDVQSCCACVSMHCDKCHKPNQSKFQQGRFCSNCGRPLKAELTRLYVPQSEVERLNKELDELAEEHSDLIVEKDQLFDIAEKQKVEIESLKIANEKMYSGIEATKANVIEEYRQRVNAKMGKHTHLLGKEYVQRILREVQKEMVGAKDV